MGDINTQNKKLVWDCFAQLRGATPGNIASRLAPYYAANAGFDGPHPINHLCGLAGMTDGFWKPFLHAFPDAAKRPYIFMGGQSIRCEDDGRFKDASWVCATGYYEATFRNDYLGIPATGGAVLLRFCEYCQVQNGAIAHTFMLLDLIDLMRQAGIVFFRALGNEACAPAPVTRGGIMLGSCDEAQGKQSIRLIEEMCFAGLNAFEGDAGALSSMGLSRYFAPDFMWYGPGGIGICRGLEGFEQQHQIPWLTAFPDRHNENFFASIGEGPYASIGGWPSMVATHTGNGWLGLPATGAKLKMRCIDWWRVEEGKIVENWVHLDIVHMLMQMGVDLFGRIRDKRYYFSR